MTVSPSQANVGRTLASLLAQQRLLEVPQAIELIRKLAEQVAVRHEAGSLHGAITADAVLLDDAEPILADGPPASSICLDGREWIDLFPELAELTPCEIPAKIEAARQRLRDAGIALDPRSVDVCQLGALFCRVVTGESAQAYLRSPRVKGKVPAELRSVLERALGRDGQKRFADVGQFLAALNAIVNQPTALVECAPPDSPSGDRPAAEPASRLRPTGDTTPSFVASGDKPADTSVGTGQSAPSQSSAVAEQESEAPLPFVRLGHYEIVARLGRGGMGDVYLAYEMALDRRVAIKVLPADLARSDEFVRRFKAEATAAARLVHPNIIQIHFIGEDAGQHYFVMQYVAGDSLAGLLARRGKLEVDETVAIAEQALSGLAAAHDQGMVHRDIKPGNILLDARHHRALLADFGLVKSLESSVAGKTATGVIMGTVDYISPEQGRGQTVDGRSDLYSIGVLLYQMLSGRLPFQADSPTALVFQHVYENPPPLAHVAPQVPARLASIIEKLLAKSPADRHQSATELLADLRTFRAGRTAPSPSEAPAYRPTSIVRLPAFNNLALPRVGDGLADVAPRWWERAGERAKAIFRQHAPEALKQLQNTCQQIDGAVAEYERRHRMLDGLALEARAVLEELEKQSQDQWAAAGVAAERAQASLDTTDRGQARDEQAACELAATEIDRQIADQRAQLEPVHLRLAQVQARVAELRNQRDILNARLKAAGARAKLHRGDYRPRRMKLPGLVLAMAACIAAVIFLLYRVRAPNQPVQSGALASNREQQSGTNELIRNQRAGMLTGLKAVVNFAAFVPVSTATFGFGFATANADGSVSLYQIRSNGAVDPAGRLSGHLKPANSLAFSPDATRLALASEDGTVSVWDVWQRREIRRLTGHTGPVTVVAFSADGSRILSAGRDGFARLWDVQAETEVKQIKLDQVRSWPGTLAWAAEGDRVVIGARTHGAESTSVLSLETKSEQNVLAGVKTPVLNAAFTRDGDRIVGLVQSSDMPFVVWDAHTGNELTTIGKGFSAVALSPDGSRALLANRNKGNSLEVWETSTASLSATLPGSGSATTPVLAISTDGGKGVSIDTEGTLKLWDLPAPPRPEHQLQSFRADSPVECVAFSADGYLALSGDAGKIHFWDLESLKTHYAYDIQNPVTAVAFSPSNDRILYATGQMNSIANFVGLRVHDVSSTRRFVEGQRDQRRFETSAKRYTAALFFDAGRQVATANADGMIRTWEVQTEKNLETADLRMPVNSMAVLGDGAQVLIGGNDNDLLVWNWKQKQETGRFRGHTFHVYSVAVSANGRVAVSGGGDRTVRVWNVETREAIAVHVGHTSRVNSVAVSPYGKLILSGSDDGSVRLWKADAPDAALILEGHVGPVRSVALSPDATRALSGGADCTVRLWDLTSAFDSKTSDQ